MIKLFAIAGTLLAGAFQTSAASNATMKECSVNYGAAQSATLEGMKRNNYRRAQYSAQAEIDSASNVSRESPHQMLNSTAKTPPTAQGDAVFPSTVSPKYRNETPGKARLHTCLDQYKANKTTGGNDDLKWTGGYYRECTSHLKRKDAQ